MGHAIILITFIYAVYALYIYCMKYFISVYNEINAFDLGQNEDSFEDLLSKEK